MSGLRNGTKQGVGWQGIESGRELCDDEITLYLVLRGWFHKSTHVAKKIAHVVLISVSWFKKHFSCVVIVLEFISAKVSLNVSCSTCGHFRKR